MRSSLLLGFAGGIVVGLLQFSSLWREVHGYFIGTPDVLLHFSPQILYFMFLYMSIKIYTRNQPQEIPDFKGCLKAGGITMVIILLFWWIAFFVGLTHTDMQALVKYKIQNGQKAELPLIFENYTMQGMFEHSKWLTLPNILLGFAVIVMVTIIFRLRGKKAI
jgi:hypothetical protein